MKQNSHQYNPLISVWVIMVSIIFIFGVAYFVFWWGGGASTPSKHEEMPKKTGIAACIEQGENPVCDEGGTEYTNACFADLANVSYTQGKCSKQTSEIISQTGTELSHEQKPLSPVNECDSEGYNPVCGTDNHTYGNACFAKSAGVNVRSNGACQKENMSQAESITPEKPTIIAPVHPSQEVQTGSTTHSDTLVDLPSNTDDNAPSLAGKLSQYDEKKYHLYSNEAVGYSFAFPKNSAYRGFGPREGAQHTLAISTTGTGVEDFTTADVKVYYYKKVPTNPPSAQSITLQNGSHVYIVNENPNEKTNAIVKDIQESLQ